MIARFALPFAVAGFLATPALADVDVVVSIKPVHSLVSAIMEGAGTPDILVDGAASPHTYSLKPSQARDLADADIVFWVGPSLEPFLEKPLETIGANATAIALDDAQGLVLLDVREGGSFEEHDHADDHDDHEREETEEHAQEGHDHDDHADEGHEDHDHHAFNPHIWLDPVNAAAMAGAIAEALQQADPDNADLYAANLAELQERMQTLTDDVASTLSVARGKPFIVFHDAYPYFENRFGLAAAGSITISPEISPGAARIAEIRDKIAGLEAVCVFSEPQFEPSLVRTVIEGTDAKSAMLDPLGAELNNGPDLYFKLIENLAASAADCLGNS